MTSRHIQIKTSPAKAVLFVGHGTRVAAGVDEFLQFCNRVERRIIEQVQVMSGLGPMPLYFKRAFLELSQPDLVSTLIKCGTFDVSRIFVVPLFLFEAGHMKQDIPELIKQARVQMGSVKVELLPAIGGDAAFIEATTARLMEAGYTGGSASESKGVLLLGRGNNDRGAQNEFEMLAKRVQAKARASLFQIGFLAGGGVNWKDSLYVLMRSDAQTIYIQPYLWFHGRLTEQLPKWVEDWKQTFPGIRPQGKKQVIRFGEPLGAHEALVSAMTDRILKVLVQ